MYSPQDGINSGSPVKDAEQGRLSRAAICSLPTGIDLGSQVNGDGEGGRLDLSEKFSATSRGNLRSPGIPVPEGGTAYNPVDRTDFGNRESSGSIREEADLVASNGNPGEWKLRNDRVSGNRCKGKGDSLEDVVRRMNWAKHPVPGGRCRNKEVEDLPVNSGDKVKRDSLDYANNRHKGSKDNRCRSREDEGSPTCSASRANKDNKGNKDSRVKEDETSDKTVSSNSEGLEL
jgi:hypothetical protein